MCLLEWIKVGKQDKLYILGASGHGAVIADIAMALGYRDIVFCDDDSTKAGQSILECPIIGDRDAMPRGAQIAVGIGRNTTRQGLIEQAAEKGWLLPILIHPSAVISPSAVIEHGTVAMANAVVNVRSVIGPGCILNTSCSVDHDCTLGASVHIAPGVRLSGNVIVGTLSMMGVGSCAIQDVLIGSNCMIGAGSTVIRDIPDDVVAYGNPAKIVKRNESV
jgi:UDP-N-acetylbacillosamine N-acetyltransferase